jgi:hypothetical protein
VLIAAVVVGYGVLGADWIAQRGWPMQKDASAVVRYLRTQEDFRYFYADYWDAYRLTFLSDERVRGVPVQVPSTYSRGPLTYGKLRIPEFRDAADGEAVVGLILRREAGPERFGPPPGWEPVYTEREYAVYLQRRHAGAP